MTTIAGMARSTPLVEAQNLGPTSSKELESIGIQSLEELTSLGWEESLDRWIQAYPERANLNAACALIGAIEKIDWRRIPARLKAEAKARVQLYQKRR